MTEIDVIIPVYKPGKEFLTLLEKLHQQTIPVNKIILFNTEQKYWESMMDRNPRRKYYENVQVYHISKREFDHGRTRRDAVKKSKAPIF
ncbi:MAG: glycosyltransferase family 2 protein, partial [Lachnospiraceae bacterium]